MFEVKKHYRGDLSYTIETTTNLDLAKRFCAEYIKQNPEASLRIWDSADRHWVMWFP